MKRFIGFVTEEFYDIFRDRRSLFILFGMPIVQVLLFGFAITNEFNKEDIAILDRSKDATTKEIINQNSASRYFSINQHIDRAANIEALVKHAKVRPVLNVEKVINKNLVKEHQATIQI